MIFRPRVAVKNRKRAKEKKANRQRIRAKEQESERSTFPRAAELTGKMELRVSARQGRRSQKLKEAHLLLRCSLWQVEFPGEPHQCTSLSQARLTSLMLLQKVGAVFRTNDKCECRICIFRHSFIHSYFILCFPESSVGKESACRETLVRFLGSEDPLEKGQATHSSVLGLSLWLSW